MKLFFIIIIYYTILVSIFIVLNPPFEAPDENLHLEYVNYLVKFKTLPNQYEGLEHKELFVGQGHQPPLYYVLLSAFTYILNSGKGINYIEIRNKLYYLSGGDLSEVPLLNNVYHNAFISYKDKIIFYSLRFISLIIGCITLFYVYKLAYIFMNNEHYSLLSTFFVASLPQFIFISSVINNDCLAICLATIDFYFIFKILNNHNESRNYLILGIIFGLSILTKKTLLFIVPGFIAVIIYIVYKNKLEWKNITKLSLIVFLLSVLVGAPLFIRNIIYYKELLGSNIEKIQSPNLISEKNIFDFAFWKFFYNEFFPQIVTSFIANFGWMNVKLKYYIFNFKFDLVFYFIYFLTFAFTIFSFIINYFRKIITKIHFLFGALFVFFCFVSIVYFNTIFTQCQGRYMFPVISIISIVIINEIFNLIKNTNRKSKIITFSILISFFMLTDLISIITIINFYYNPLMYK